MLRFDRFSLDPADRRLLCDGAAVELNARYFDALALLVREAGKLVSKERFLEEVWRGVPVTDEALTQCIRTLRKQLGDDAAHPRFIETVPKHGYRFVAPVESDAATAPTAAPPAAAFGLRQWLLLGGAGTLGGGVAGLFGGMLYGFAGASQATGGRLSILLVLIAMTVALALIGGAGVAFGIAAAGFAPSHRGAWTVAGGALGGLIVGALVKLVGLDAFAMLFGRSPGDITGAPEGALLGAAVGIGAWLAGRAPALSLRRSIGLPALTGALGGLIIALTGGRLLGGSLALLAEAFPAARPHLAPIGGLFGENGIGPVSQIATAALEGALFAGCLVAALVFARQRLALD
ncbi:MULTISPECIES: winged helix-turn-helix domain-containing protein [unclassified Sphingopyxis]|uniref:winged helix-turn-helix domain-containing protein n=1 Tax=unclassified Sphingopyxis TaxID=2614943 RepID=UPI0009EBF2F9|nr:MULTISPECIES: winged helix-turn-helix domain-containing protein [unclassified Sphingopyxis]